MTRIRRTPHACYRIGRPRPHLIAPKVYTIKAAFSDPHDRDEVFALLRMAVDEARRKKESYDRGEGE